MDLNTRTLRAPLPDRQRVARILLDKGTEMDEIQRVTGLLPEDLHTLRSNARTLEITTGNQPAKIVD